MLLQSVELEILTPIVQHYSKGYKYTHLRGPDGGWYRLKPGVQIEVDNDLLEPITGEDRKIVKGGKQKVRIRKV